MKEQFVVYDINRIIFVGQDEYPERIITFSNKKLFYHELIYHFSGESVVYFNDERLPTPPNSIRYLPLGDCTKYTVERIEKGDCIDIFFTSNIPLNDRACVWQVKNGKIGTLFKKIFTIWVQKDEGYYLECVSLLYKILAEMQKTSYLPDAQFNKIKPAVEYIQNNFLSQEEITAEKLAKTCGISYSYIKRLFSLKYKISPKRYILQLKMNYACDLLRHEEHTVSQIAEICGYKDLYTFSHQFKIEFGVSPSEFRKNYTSSK
jgi:AraC-like DNA-binding protein